MFLQMSRQFSGYFNDDCTVDKKILNQEEKAESPKENQP